ncbi:acetoacetate--CoA ligase [Desulfosediminicola sp.]|uniref:acetoacetate--CoA ligase n=1 Tax=Desulfosediminicola sp. TaxID=2886825 RepID=UPI003AF25A33
MTQSKPLWVPDRERTENSLLKAFMRFVGQQLGAPIEDYSRLYDWSISDSPAFWSALWDFCGVIGDKGVKILDRGNEIERACWFSDAKLNFAENLLKRRDDEPALIFYAEDKVHYNLSFNELYNQTAAMAAWLKSIGIEPGDRVAAYLPNMPETVVAMLAATSIGAIWSSTSPDFGFESVVDRFGQIEPKVLFRVDGYFYNGKTIDLGERGERIIKALPSIAHDVLVPLLKRSSESSRPCPASTEKWGELLERFAGSELQFERRPFNIPLCILYSSGTTGKPKCITHKAGGVLLQHLKEHQLHCDIQPGDRVFYFTTCGWMMWNWLVSALGSEASLVLYDGSPFSPDNEILWRLAEKESITLFGTSAKYIDTMKKLEMVPVERVHLPSLRTLCSTGSVLTPESFDYVYESIKRDICLSSISGGTDIISCFVLGNPILPVYRGECQCRGLGMAVQVYNAEGEAVVNEKGELVCTRTFPSQPVYFWNDRNGNKYHNAYFARFQNVWYHGDYVKLTPNGGVIIYGRSDATLNPGGVRIGTAEIYRYVEDLDEVAESIVVAQDWQNDQRIILFVVLRNGTELTDKLTEKIKTTLREKCSPRHVPAKVVQIDEIPRTKSGKIVELAVREIIHNRDVKNIGSLANPEALEAFRDIPELR